MDMDFLTAEIDATMEVESDLSNPLDIPNIVAGAQKSYWDKQLLKKLISVYNTRLKFLWN